MEEDGEEGAEGRETAGCDGEAHFDGGPDGDVDSFPEEIGVADGAEVGDSGYDCGARTVWSISIKESRYEKK